jgi:hypothetical protein
LDEGDVFLQSVVGLDEPFVIGKVFKGFDFYPFFFLFTNHTARGEVLRPTVQSGATLAALENLFTSCEIFCYIRMCFFPKN